MELSKFSTENMEYHKKWMNCEGFAWHIAAQYTMELERPEMAMVLKTKNKLINPGKASMLAMFP